MANKYETLYQSLQLIISEQTTAKEAEKIIRELGQMYNAIGKVIKDVVSLLSLKFTHAASISYQKTTQTSKYSNQNSKKNCNSEKVKNQQEDKLQTLKNNLDNMRAQTPALSYFKTSLKSKYSQESKSNPFIPLDNLKQKIVERVVGVKSKSNREELNGYSCEECKKFYEVIEGNDNSQATRICNCFSRHRSNLPPTKFGSFSPQFGFDQ